MSVEENEFYSGLRESLENPEFKAEYERALKELDSNVYRIVSEGRPTRVTGQSTISALDDWDF